MLVCMFRLKALLLATCAKPANLPVQSFATLQDNYSRDLHETYLLDSPLLEAGLSRWKRCNCI